MADLTIKPWQVTLTIQDGEGQTSKHSVYYGAVTWAALRQWLTDYIDAVEAVIDGSVTDVDVSRELVVTDPKPVDPDSDNQHRLRVQMMDTATATRRISLSLPTISPDAMTGPIRRSNGAYLRELRRGLSSGPPRAYWDKLFTLEDVVRETGETVMIVDTWEYWTRRGR